MGQLCAIHALNNIFQREEFSQDHLDLVATEMRYNQLDVARQEELGDDMVRIGGDYNIATIERALEIRNYNIVRLFENELDDALRLNSLGTGGFLIGTGAHWFGIRQFSDTGLLWNFDSVLEQPVAVNSLAELISHIDPGTGRRQYHNVFRITPLPS